MQGYYVLVCSACRALGEEGSTTSILLGQQTPPPAPLAGELFSSSLTYQICQAAESYLLSIAHYKGQEATVGRHLNLTDHVAALQLNKFLHCLLHNTSSSNHN